MFDEFDLITVVSLIGMVSWVATLTLTTSRYLVYTMRFAWIIIILRCTPSIRPLHAKTAKILYYIRDLNARKRARRIILHKRKADFVLISNPLCLATTTSQVTIKMPRVFTYKTKMQTFAFTAIFYSNVPNYYELISQASNARYNFAACDQSSSQQS